MITEVGSVDNIGYDPVEGTVELYGEYGLFRFETDEQTIDRLTVAIEAIEEHQ